jgi:hypothetical protein
MATDVRPAAVIVCERSGRIAAALRRQLDPRVPVLETRSTAECLQTLSAWPASILIAGAGAAELERAIRLLSQTGRQFPLVRCVIVADRQLEPAEELLREAGAVHVQFGLRGVDVLAAMVRRHAAEFRQPPTMLDEIWKQIPWSGE